MLSEVGDGMSNRSKLLDDVPLGLDVKAGEVEVESGSELIKNGVIRLRVETG